jgi:hypothetical protein
VETRCVAQDSPEPDATAPSPDTTITPEPDTTGPAPDVTTTPEPDTEEPAPDVTITPEPDTEDPPPTTWAPGDLVITEFMANPEAVSDSDGEWFELYNASGESRNLAGLAIVDDEGTEDTLAASLVVPAGGYVVLSSNDDTSANGDVAVDATYTFYIALANTSDTLGVSMDGTVLDMVSWGAESGFPPIESGVALQLAPEHLDAVANDLGESWCRATTTYGDGDLGSPGEPNPACPDGGAAAGDLVVTELMINPGAANDVHGEWVELYNASDTSIDLEGLTLHDGASEQNVVLDSLLLPAGDYVVLGVSGDTSLNGGVVVDHVLADLSLKNTSDDLIVERDGIVFDTVSYDTEAGFPSSTGQAMNLSANHASAEENDDPSHWCLATTPYGDGDLGTPGAPNPPCSDQSCCVSTVSAGCDVESCATAVCAIDDYCCDSAWSGYCVACALGGESYDGEDCSSVLSACPCDD